MSGRLDVIALGETMLSIVAVDGPISKARTFHTTHGGAESNTTVGLVRLGMRAAWVSRLGADAIGDRVAASLEAEGVDLRWVKRDPDRPTGVMIRDTRGCVEYRRSGSAASGMEPGDLDGVPIGETQAVLVTGVTTLIGDGPREAALALLESTKGIRVVDPNLRPGLWGSDRAAELILPLVARSDLVLGGERELQALLGADEGQALARHCRDLGPSEVVIKRGRDGAAVLDREGRWHEHAPPPGHDLDPVGAGDAFNAGYLAARLRDRSAPQALVEGARCGAAVAGSIGDTDGFPQT